MTTEKQIFSQNLKKFLKDNNLSQIQLARTLDISNASISNYIKGISEPTLSFFYKFKKCFNLSVDYFFSDNELKEITTVKPLDITRFSGNYILYFYDSASYIGSVSGKTKNPLRYGVLSIYFDKTLKTKTLFFKQEDQAIQTKQYLDTCSVLEIASYYNSNENSYEGECDISGTQVFIKLKNFNDNVLIILNNPPSKKIYIGGLGTVNSVSRGREHMPCIQFILLTRDILNLSEDEVYNLLSVDVPSINLHFESEKLIELFKSLYIENNSLQEYQKRKIFENSLENAISSAIEANVFRYAKVSGREDDYYYNVIRKTVD